MDPKVLEHRVLNASHPVMHDRILGTWYTATAPTLPDLAPVPPPRSMDSTTTPPDDESSRLQVSRLQQQKQSLAAQFVLMESTRRALRTLISHGG